MTCYVEGCGKRILARSMCSTHYDRWRRNGDPEVLQRRPKGSGAMCRRGDIMLTIDGRHVFEHVLIAEVALGKPLPEGACVHHADGDPSNNRNDNLVICPNQAYHSLLHMRMRAFAACGNASWRKCKRCRKWDAVDNLSIYANEAVHPACNRQHVRQLKEAA